MQDNTPQRWGFNYTADFSAVPQGGQQTQTIRIDGDVDFTVLSTHFAANFAAGVQFISRSNIAGIDATANTPNFTPVTLQTQPKLYRQADTNTAQASNAHLGLIKLAFQINDRPWQSAPMRADLITAEPGSIFILPVPPVLIANSVLNVVLYNNLPTTVGGATGHTIDAQLILVGYKQRRS